MSREQLERFIKEELDSELAGQGRRVVEAASKGNRITSEKFGRSIFRYLDTIYWGRIVQYVEEEIRALEERLFSRLRSSIEEISGTINAAQSTADAAQSTASDVNSRLLSLSNRVDSLSRQIQDLRNSINNS